MSQFQVSQWKGKIKIKWNKDNDDDQLRSRKVPIICLFHISSLMDTLFYKTPSYVMSWFFLSVHTLTCAPPRYTAAKNWLWMHPADHVNTLVCQWRLSDWSTASGRLFVDSSCKQRPSPAMVHKSMATLLWLLLADLKPWERGINRASFWSSSWSGMRMLSNEERDTGSTKWRLIPSYSKIFDTLAVSGTALSIP